MNQEELRRAFNELRVLVLMECEDGMFRQVGLSPAQFKKVSDDILTDKHKDDSLKPGYEMAEFNLNLDWEEPADTFLGLSSSYDDII